ncbi:hypothetical protein [Rhizobium sp. BK176]|uniref:hypothetical protein n=1 Tax=Rhizobium sp. BK176 TaxID=2587071 RepID=UPI00216A5E0E|nr:hypothetical protein [Rhizobium sp. BK176]MCS4090034.1 hypothetical protein [Rhizobium sp. BK176]
MARYLVSDYPLETEEYRNELWNQIFERGDGETPVRFVYDRELEELKVALVRVGHAVEDRRPKEIWEELPDDKGAALQESIERKLWLEEPTALIETDELPEWAGVPEPATTAPAGPAL